MQFILFFLLFTSIGFSQEKIKLAYDDSDLFPWTFTNQTGLDFTLLKLVDEKLKDVDFEYLPVPWTAAFIRLKKGDYDGLFQASYKPERDEFGVYPKLGDNLDESKMLHLDSYSFYTLKDSNITFDGKKLSVADNELISILKGYSVIDEIIKMGYQVDSSASSHNNNFERLIHGSVKVVADLTLTADRLLMAPKFSDKIVKLAPPIKEKPYYLLFSHQLYEKNPKLCSKIWSEIEKMRNSTAYKKALNTQ